MFCPGIISASEFNPGKTAKSMFDIKVVAFQGERLVGEGSPEQVIPEIRAAESAHNATSVVVFDASTSEFLGIDLRGSVDEVIARTKAASSAGAGETTAGPTTDDAADQPRGPGRPRLGVVAREVTLLPRHWDWLTVQPGGASAALRRLVDQARSANSGRDRVRRAQESAYRFMSTMLGDATGFEEATRALFAGDRDRFTTHSELWPPDLRTHARRLATEAFPTD
jgi:hypothetical protein